MNTTHLHLMLNHVSIMAAIFSVLIYFTAYFKRNASIKNVAYAGFILAALAAIPVFLTGEPAEESIEHLPGIIESASDAHGDAAEIALWLIELTGIAALASLFANKIKFLSKPVFTILLMILSIGSAVSISYTGYLGGQIRHTELSLTSIGQGEIQNEKGESQEKDED